MSALLSTLGKRFLNRSLFRPYITKLQYCSSPVNTSRHPSGHSYPWTFCISFQVCPSLSPDLGRSHVPAAATYKGVFTSAQGFVAVADSTTIQLTLQAAKLLNQKHAFNSDQRQASAVESSLGLHLFLYKHYIFGTSQRSQRIQEG